MTKKIVIDLDETISLKIDGRGYEYALPRNDVIDVPHVTVRTGIAPNNDDLLEKLIGTF